MFFNMLITCNWMLQSRAQWACSGQPHYVFDYEGSVFFLVCHTSCLCSHFICPRQVHVRPLVSVLRISPDFQILVSSRFVLFFFCLFSVLDYWLCWLEWLHLLYSVPPFLWTALPSSSGVLLGNRFSDSIFDHLNVEIDMNITKEKVREQQPQQKTEWFCLSSLKVAEISVWEERVK